MLHSHLTNSLRELVKRVGRTRRTRKNVKQITLELRRILVQADVSVNFAERFSEEVGQRMYQVANQAGISEIFEEGLKDALTGKKEQPVLAGRILVTGLNGAGKTTTTAKIAKFLSKMGEGVGVVAADTRRPGAVEQLKTLAEQAKVPFFFKREAPVLSLLKEGRKWGNNYHTVLFDTAGRQETEGDLMRELCQIAEVVEPDVVLYVCDGNGGQQLAKSGKIFADAIGIDGIILTKLDGDGVGGVVLGLVDSTGAPVVFSGVGEKIDDLEVFQPAKMSKRILGMGGLDDLIIKIQDDDHWDFCPSGGENINLDDFIKTTRMIRKLGPLTKVARATGWGAESLDESVEQFHFSKIDAIFNSMTREERRNPELLECHQRIERISTGAGVGDETVLEFLGRFRSMRELLSGSIK